MPYATGTLVKTRGREWVVLPDSTEDLLVLRPLGGREDEVAGVYLPLEGDDVRPATFDLPDPQQVGDHRSCRLLRDAVRFGFRNSAGPFRSLGAIAVEPRPYQLVPLLMALKLDPVRLLIADDVGIGKTVEALLIARELLDRGEARRLAVLCPPHLAEQWQAEMSSKFHLEAELVLPGTVGRLERQCRLHQSVFERFPITVVSTDYIKSDRHRDDFLRTAPDLVIVDEAHTCVDAGAPLSRSSRHQRHRLVAGLAQKDPTRHMLLVTATPHSGKEDAFRQLLGFLRSEFATLPADLAGRQNEPHRRKLAGHFVQRRRGDIRHYMQADTPFPEREAIEVTYSVSPAWRSLLERVRDYARETVMDESLGKHRQRVRWWSALALLRSLASSPAAAVTTLRNRAAAADTETPEGADEVGSRSVLDLLDDETAEGMDVSPGADPGEEGDRHRRRLLEFAREADKLRGKADPKLQRALTLVAELVEGGFHPILFCRFIPTAEYVAEELRARLKGVEVAAVTGTLPPAEREERVLRLAESAKRVLVCTDCLSEGINLQGHFDAVVHYDLSWNPTRHEQREGRVDRYGQPRQKVRIVTFFGKDNPVDGIVLQVLLRKHETIKNSLGISVPVPGDPNAVVEALFEGLLLHSDPGKEQMVFDFMEEEQRELHGAWDEVAQREVRSRGLFAQHAIHPEEVRCELEESRRAIGSAADVARFVEEAVRRHQGVIRPVRGATEVDLTECPRAMQEAVGQGRTFRARFELPVRDGEVYLSRTHPAVEGLATHVLDTALDTEAEGAGRRCGALRTRAVARRTTLLLVRLRHHLTRRFQDGSERQLLAEECRLLAFRGAPGNAEWLEEPEAEALLDVDADGTMLREQASEFVGKVVEGIESLRPHLEEVARERARALLDSHRRVRDVAGGKGRLGVEPQLPVDVLGIYVFLPASTH